MNLFKSSSTPFLKKRFNFFVLLGVVASTVFSWYLVNSWLIGLLVICRLADGGPLPAIKTAFTNKYFIAYLVLFLIGAAGLFYTHDHLHASRSMTKEATMVAISFAICGGLFADALDYRRFMTSYCGIMFLAAGYCLITAAIHYEAMPLKDNTVFFYHALTSKVGFNAVFFTVYMIFGLLFLLSQPMEMGKVSVRIRRGIQIFLIFFYIGIIILLSSKLLLIVLVLILASVILHRFIIQRNYKATAGVMLAAMLVAGWALFTDNPIKDRYMDLRHGQMTTAKQDSFANYTQFNGASLRLLQWRFANQILDEHSAWIAGVSPGDAQDLLNEKYRKANIFVGAPNTKARGYWDYNFHNQYLETMVRSGFLGLAALIFVCWLIFSLADRRKTAETVFTALTLLSTCAVESFLTLQHGVFAFVFMPLVLLYSPKKAIARKLKPLVRHPSGLPHEAGG